MIKNINSFIKGGCLGILVLLVSVLSFLNLRQWSSKAQADSLICTTSGSDLIFTNTEATPKYITCDEYTNCNCPGEPYDGVCIVNHNRRWIHQVAPGQSETCNFSQSVESLANCKVHQMDILVWDGDYEQQTGQWRLPTNCWFLSNKCDKCEEPTPTPTAPLTPTSTPTPTTAISPTPTPTIPLISTPTPTLAISSTPTPTPTPTPRLTCQSSCSSDGDCADDLRCQDISGTKKCVNTKCPTEGDCVCNKNCWDSCSYSSECPQNYVCQDTDGTWRCVHPDCNKEQDCECNQPEVLGIEAPKVLPKAGFALNGFFLAGIIIFALRYLLLKV